MIQCTSISSSLFQYCQKYEYFHVNSIGCLTVLVFSQCGCIFSQGVLYVFGGLRDTAYSNSKTPLWLFDTGNTGNLHSNKPFK